MLAGQWLIPISSIANPLIWRRYLVNSPTVKTQPNLLFVLDDSGSMGWDYMPDWANSGDVTLFRNASYNTLAYNPALRYLPPAYFDTSGLNTTKYPSQTGTSTDTGADTSTKPNWKKVNDAYLSTSTSDITNDANFYTFIPSEYCTKKDLKVLPRKAPRQLQTPIQPRYAGAIHRQMPVHPRQQLEAARPPKQAHSRIYANPKPQRLLPSPLPELVEIPK